MSLGIVDRNAYLEIGPERRYSGSRVAFTLLRVSDPPTPEEIRTFEDICFNLRLSNGTWRTTFRDRFLDVDEMAIRLMAASFPLDSSICVQDRAVSSALTSAQWATRLFATFPNAHFEASDLMTELLEISPAKPGGPRKTKPGGTRESYITELSGTPLQYIRPPFVVALNYPESWRNPLLRFVAARALKRYPLIRKNAVAAPISCVHPEAQMLARSNPNFTVVLRSVFDSTPAACDVLRTMNILNRSYFSAQQLQEASAAIFSSLRPNGIWIAGKTREDDFTNHTTFFRRRDQGWEVIGRIGSGSEIEGLALADRPAA